jgi:pimeloyl-ACP methyl ester carboxylesterase
MPREHYYGAGGVECKLIFREGKSPPVLFLHGYSFTGNIWSEAGITDVIEKYGLKYAAPDMPYGKNTECTKHTRDIELNVEAVRNIVEVFFGGEKPVIIGASLGGKIALHYTVRYGAKALFLASPAIKKEDKIWNLLRILNIPIVVIRGGNDFIPRSILKRLAEKTKATYLEYENAGHAMYLDDPERFKRDLEQFISKIILQQ